MNVQVAVEACTDNSTGGQGKVQCVTNNCYSTSVGKMALYAVKWNILNSLRSKCKLSFLSKYTVSLIVWRTCCNIKGFHI